MNEQNILESFFKYVSKLEFSYQHRLQYFFENDSLYYDEYNYEILIKTKCNGLDFKEFQNEIKYLAREVEDKIEENPDLLLITIKNIKRKIEDLFTFDGKYNGEKTHLCEIVIPRFYGTIYSCPPHPQELREFYGNELINCNFNFDLGKSYKDLEIVEVKYIHPLEKYFDCIQLKLNSLLNTLNDQKSLLTQSNFSINKLNDTKPIVKWNASNSALAYLIILLSDTENKGKNKFIELPINFTTGKENYTETANWLLNSFQLKSENISMDRFIKELKPTENTLTLNNQQKLKDILNEIKKFEKIFNNN